MELPYLVFIGEGRSAFPLYGKKCDLSYAYHIGIFVTVAFLETKRLALEAKCLSSNAQLKLDFFKMQG